jgi:hypothetical protein
MGQPESKPRLIRTKRGAVIALCLTGYVAALSFRNVLLQSHHRPPFLIDSHFLLPAWAETGISLAFYACLIWGGSAVFHRLAPREERVLVGGWMASFFLSLIKFLVSAPTYAALDYLKAFAMLIALLAAVGILFRMPASGYPRLDDQTSRNA